MSPMEMKVLIFPNYVFTGIKLVQSVGIYKPVQPVTVSCVHRPTFHQQATIHAFR